MRTQNIISLSLVLMALLQSASAELILGEPIPSQTIRGLRRNDELMRLGELEALKFAVDTVMRASQEVEVQK